MSMMVVLVVVFLVGLAVWAVLEVALAQGIGQALGPDDGTAREPDPEQLQRLRGLNSRGLTLGLIAAVCGFSSVFVGLASAFGGLDDVPADQRAALLAGRISTTMNITGLPVLVAVILGVAAPVVWWVQRKKLTFR